MNDTEVAFRHRFKEKIYLDDIYVYPDLREKLKDLNKISKTFDASNLHKEKIKRVLIIGDEQSGKTALAKITYKNLYKNERNQPIFIDCNEINKADAIKIVEKQIANQYIGIDYKNFVESDRSKILILDNFESIKLNTKFQKALLDNFDLIFDYIYIFSNLYIIFNDSKYIDLPSYKQYEILPFNNLKRGGLIEKWNSLGQEEIIDTKSLHNANDWITYNVDGIIRKNILPAKPIYILSVIQHLDSSKTNDYSLTSYGHCYQSLIQKSLEQSNIKADEFDQFINYLSELSYYIFLTRRESISKQQLEEFKMLYSNKYVIFSHDHILQSLLMSGIIKNNDDSYRFSYRYIFYFYVAKYISEHLDKKTCKSEITRLCENIHTEKNSNILIFLVHHSKDQYIIDEILLHAEINFDKYPAAKLDKNETKYLESYVINLPDLVIEQRNIDDERRKKLIKKDMAYRNEEAQEEINYNEVDFHQQEEKQELSVVDKTFSEINTSIRLTEIIGQILRNRHGSLTKDQLKDLTLAAYESGLKFLSCFINETESNQDHIINIIQDLIRKNASKSNEQITKLARDFFLFICYTIIYSVLNKIKDSIGTNKLMPVFEEITVENIESPAIQLLQIAIYLEFKKEIPKREIDQFYSRYKNDQIIVRLLQEIVIQHLYLNHIDHAERQWLSNKLGLPIETQRRIQDNLKFITSF